MTAPLRMNGKLLAKIARSCTSKSRYSDEYGARAAGQLYQEWSGVKLFMYPCSECRGWHLTKHPQRKDRHDVDFVYPAARRGV